MSDPRLWMIRAGRDGRNENLAVAESVSVIGWSELGELSVGTTRDQLKDRIQALSGETRTASLASQAGQIHRFLHDVSVGDIVALPLMRSPGHVAIGRVLGDYQHRVDGVFKDTDAQHTRPVQWLARDLGYERFDPDLREAFGLQGTVREITKPNAVQRIMAVIEGADASAIHLVLKWSAALSAARWA